MITGEDCSWLLDLYVCVRPGGLGSTAAVCHESIVAV